MTNATVVLYACCMVTVIAIGIAFLIRNSNYRSRKDTESRRDYNCLTIKMAYGKGYSDEPKRKPANNLFCNHTVHEDGFTSIVSIRRDVD